MHVTGSSTTVNNFIDVFFVRGEFYVSTCSRSLDLPVNVEEYDSFKSMLTAATGGVSSFTTM